MNCISRPVLLWRRRNCPDNLYVFYLSFCLVPKERKGQVKAILLPGNFDGLTHESPVGDVGDTTISGGQRIFFRALCEHLCGLCVESFVKRLRSIGAGGASFLPYRMPYGQIRSTLLRHVLTAQSRRKSCNSRMCMYLSSSGGGGQRPVEDFQ